MQSINLCNIKRIFFRSAKNQTKGCWVRIFLQGWLINASFDCNNCLSWLLNAYNEIDNTSRAKYYSSIRITLANLVILDAQHNSIDGFFNIFSLLPNFLLLYLQLHLCADWLSRIGARQPIGLNYWSRLAAAYPTRGRSKHHKSWASICNCG